MGERVHQGLLWRPTLKAASNPGELQPTPEDSTLWDAHLAQAQKKNQVLVFSQWSPHCTSANISPSLDTERGC